MSIIQAIVYGIVQGIGEFLPISSTAHIILVPWLLGWRDPGVAFDVALHLGTATAVILFFLKDWIRLIGAGFSRPKSKNGKLFWLIVLATIPGGNDEATLSLKAGFKTRLFVDSFCPSVDHFMTDRRIFGPIRY
jgi:undecaprenyl pyrophosphate phosphatase UppP